MWTAVFWAGWVAVTVAVWRREWRRPPDDPDIENAHMKRHLQRNYPADN